MLLTTVSKSGNINKLSQDGKNHENFIVWKFSQIKLKQSAKLVRQLSGEFPTIS